MALRDNLISWWELNETSGTRVDAHGTNDLADNNTVLSAAGKQGNAADLEAGNSESLSIADASQSGLDISGDFTIAFWMKRESDTQCHLIGKRDGNSGPSSRAYAIWLAANGTSTLDVNISDGTTDTWKWVTWEPTNGVWYFVVLTYDASAGTAKFYIDGSQQGSDMTGLPTSVNNNSIEFTIGVNGGTPGNYYDGLMDEVAIWSRVITTAEITDLYNSGSGLSYADTDSGAAYTQDINESVSITESQQRETGKNLSDTTTITDSAQKDTSKAFSDSYSVTDSVETIKVLLLELADTVNITDTIQRAVGKVVAETVTITETVKRGVTKAWNETVSIADTVTALTATYSKELLETVNITDTVSTITGYVRSFTENLTITDRLYGLLNGVNMEYVDTYSNTVGDYVDQYFNV